MLNFIQMAKFITLLILFFVLLLAPRQIYAQGTWDCVPGTSNCVLFSALCQENYGPEQGTDCSTDSWPNCNSLSGECVPQYQCYLEDGVCELNDSSSACDPTFGYFDDCGNRTSANCESDDVHDCLYTPPSCTTGCVECDGQCVDPTYNCWPYIRLPHLDDSCYLGTICMDNGSVCTPDVTPPPPAPGSYECQLDSVGGRCYLDYQSCPRGAYVDDSFSCPDGYKCCIIVVDPPNTYDCGWMEFPDGVFRCGVAEDRCVPPCYRDQCINYPYATCSNELAVKNLPCVCPVATPVLTPIYPRDPLSGCGQNEITTAVGCIPADDLTELAEFLIKWAVGIGGGIAFLLMIYAGFLITTSGGDAKKVQGGRELLTAAIAGLMMLLFSTFILEMVGIRILHLPGF